MGVAVNHKILPPTLNVEEPNPKVCFQDSPFYVNTETRPWINGNADHLRRAGVSSFGFGGTNFHAVLEEYQGEFLESRGEAPLQDWPGEVMLWAGASREEIAAAVKSLEQVLERGATPKLSDLAYTLWQLAKDRLSGNGRSMLRLVIVATSLLDLRQKLDSARQKLANREETVQGPRGIYFAENPLAYEGKVAFLFPGQGSQHVDMLRELALYFPEMRERFEVADGVLADRLGQPLSTYVFPPPRFTQEEERARQRALTETNVAQPALGAASLGVFRLLKVFGFPPQIVP